MDLHHRQEEQREQADAIRDALTHLAEEEETPERDDRKQTGEGKVAVLQAAAASKLGIK